MLNVTLFWRDIFYCKNSVFVYNGIVFKINISENMDYISDIMKKYPPFKTKEEEDEMIKNYLKKNDVQGMRNELVLRNVGLIRKYSKLWNTLYTKDECASFGIEGLVKAANTFDTKVGVRFSTYAGFAIRTILRRKKDTVRNKIDERCVSLDAEYRIKNSEKETIADIIDGNVRDEFRVVKPTKYYVGANDTTEFIFRLLKGCGCSERDMSVFRNVVVDGTPLEHIGRELHISRERVRQIYEKTCRKLRGNIGKMQKAILNKDNPTIKDFEHRKSYQFFKDGRVVSKSVVCGVDWNAYYDSIKYSQVNCFIKLRDIIRDGIVS